MAKRFKLKLSRVIPSFQFCRSKNPSSFPESPLPLIYRLSPINSKLFDMGFPSFPDPPPSTPEHSSKIVSIGCGCRSRLCTQYNESSENVTESPDHSSSKSLVSKAKHNSKHRKTDQNPSKPSRILASTPSTDRSGFFSSDGDDDDDRETESLISSSSRTFSNYSSNEISNSEKSINQRRNKKTNNAMKHRRLKSYISMKNKQTNLETKSPLKATVLCQMMMPCTAEGKVAESVAVVKKSEDPYQDFKKSMLEMISEKQMFDAEELEQLLQCFLTLNSRRFHGVIVDAFSEIWEILFSDFPVNVPMGY